MFNEGNTTVAIYCRVSTEEQAVEGFSIKEQEEILSEYCRKQGYEIYYVYVDAGISGKDIQHRPGMSKLLEDATEKKFNMVISWKINRISRKLKDALQIVDIFEKYGITYKSYSEPFESDTPVGKMQFQMMALVGEFERSTIAQNVKMGMCAKAKAGEWCGGAAPLGYRWAPMPGSEDLNRKKSMLVVVPEEAEVVRRIYEEYASGKGYKAIVNQLNKEGYKSKQGNPFAVGQLKTILSNPVYIGKVRFNVRRGWNEKHRRDINPHPIISEGIHEAIVAEDLWKKVQAMLGKRGKRPPRIYDGEYPLTGILRCPECGAGMTMARSGYKLKDGTKKYTVYYACGAWKNKGTAVCHSNMISAKKAEQVVFQKLEQIISSEAILKAVVDRVNNASQTKAKEVNRKLKQFEGKIKDLHDRKQKIFQAYEDGIITAEELRQRKTFLDEEEKSQQEKRKELEKDLTDINIEGKEISYDLVRYVLENFSKIMDDPKIEGGLKKRLIHALISKITINNQREIDSIHLHLTKELLEIIQRAEGISKTDIPSVFLYSKFQIPAMELNIKI